MQDRTIETRLQILRAASSEFAEKGFVGASTRVIAARGDVHHASVTYHFGTKEALYRSVVKSYYERFKAMYGSRIEAINEESAALRLRVILEGFIAFSFENPDFHAIMRQNALMGGEQLEWMYRDHIGEFFFEMARLIAMAQKEGTFVAGEPKHLTYLFIGAVTRIFPLRKEVEMVLGESIDGPTFKERHTELCLSLFFRTAG